MAERAAGAEMLSIHFHITPSLECPRVVVHNDIGCHMPLMTETIFGRGAPFPEERAREEPGHPIPRHIPVELPGEGEFIYWHSELAIEEDGTAVSAVLREPGASMSFDALSWKFFSLMEKPVPFGAVIHNAWLSPAASKRLVLACIEKNILRVEDRPLLFCSSEIRRCLLPPQAAAFLSCRNEGAGECIVRASDGLYRSKRGSKVLVVDPDSASWAVIPERYDAMLQALQEPAPFSRICSSFPSLEPVADLLQKMYFHGFISLDGRKCFPDPGIMWPPLDDRPLYPRSFYLHMTDACNFRCSYCYARAEIKGRTMSFSVAARIIDRVLKEIPFDDLYFEFHGGEPLLVKEDIAAIVRYGKEKASHEGKRLHFSLQTNGSLLDDDVIAWARQWKVQVGISLDGPPSLHDRYRKMPDGRGTFAVVWDAVQRAWRGGLEPGFMAVINEGADYLRAYEFFVSSGIMNFKANYRASLGRAADHQEDLRERGESLAAGFLAMVDEASNFNRISPCRVRIHDLNLYLAALMGKKREYMCLRSPCGAGRSLLAFGPRGEIYPCEEMSTYPEFSCGGIDSAMPLTELIDSSPVILSLRERRVESIPRCSTCPWRRFCGGRCLHKAYHHYGTIMREDPLCTFYGTLFEALMWKIDADPEVLSLM